MKVAVYNFDLTDEQWNYLKPMLPKPARRGRPPTDRRQVINAILYVVKGGVQWRMLLSSFPPWKTVYHIFRKWTLERIWHGLNVALRMLLRVADGKRSRATAMILDSKNVKSDPRGGEVGFDAGKRIRGRKAFFWSTRSARCWGLWSPRPVRRSGTARNNCSRAC